MSESERSESYGTPMSSDDAAELEELRREAAVLREQLENAVGPQSGLRSARDVHQLEARIDSLAARNEKLTETLKEARSSCSRCARRSTGSASRPAATASSSAVPRRRDGRRVHLRPAMRVAVSPAVDVGDAAAGPDRAPERGAHRRRGRRLRAHRRGLRAARGAVDRRALRALVVGHADEERVVWLAEPSPPSPARHDDDPDPISAAQAGPATRCSSTPRPGYAYERVPKAEVEDLVLEEVPDVDYTDIGGLFRQIEQIRDAVELPFLHAELFREYELRPPKGVLLYGPPGCGKTLIAKAVANSLAKKVAAVRGDDPDEAQVVLPQHQGPRAAQQVRRRDRAAHPADLPAGPGEGLRGHPGDRVLRRDGLDLPHPRVRCVLRRRDHDRARSCSSRSTASRAWRTSSSSAPPTART